MNIQEVKETTKPMIHDVNKHINTHAPKHFDFQGTRRAFFD